MGALRIIRYSLAALSVTILVSCTTTPSGSWCDIARPQRPSQAEIDAMSDARVAEVLAWNRKGAKLCNWRS